MYLSGESLGLTLGVLGPLVLATIVGLTLRRTVHTDTGIAVVDNLNARIRAWWMICAVFGIALALGRTASVVLFTFVSFLALREFVTITQTRLGDHRALFWAFFVITPLQYVLVARGWYGVFSILIPVCAFVFIPVRTALAGDTTDFLERTAETQ